MKFNKALLSLLLLLALQARSSAQHYYYRSYWPDRREIATDYNTCLQGVKDSTGQWVIQPQYELVVRYDSCYLISAGGKAGLLDYNGKVKIPLMYDYLNPCDLWWESGPPNYFYVMLQGKHGIVDSANKVVVPVTYQYVRAYYDSSFVARKTKRTYDFYNAQGTKFPCPWKSKKLPDHEAAHLYVMKGPMFRRKEGMLNDSGKIILPRKYSQINPYSKTHTVQIYKKNRYGYCSTAGKEIWPIVFTRPSWQEDHSDYNYLTGVNGTGPAKLNGKFGLISLKGDTLLPFIYDYIGPFSLYDAPELWEVESGSLTGIYNSNSGWLLNPACTEISSFASYRNEKDSSVVSLLVAQMNGKWGAMTTGGQTVIPFECSEILYTYRAMDITFLKGDSLLTLSVTTLNQRASLEQNINPNVIRWIFWESSDEQANKLIPADNRFSVFKGKDGVRTYYHPGLTKDSLLVDTVKMSAATGNYYGMKVPDSIFIASCFSVIPILKPVQHYEQFDFYGVPTLDGTDSTKQYPHICRRHAAKGTTLARIMTFNEPFYITTNHDLLKNDGSVLISGDTVSQVEVEHHLHDGSLYFEVQELLQGRIFAVDTNGKMAHPKTERLFDDFNGNYTWYMYYDRKYRDRYELVDNRTNKPVIGPRYYSEEAYPIWDSLTIVNTREHGARLYNLAQRKFYTTSGFEEIIPLRSDGTLFAVKTCSHNIGVVDAKGNTVLDTIYTALTCVDRLGEIKSNTAFRTEFFGTFYTAMIFYNGQQSVMLDLVKKKVIPHNEAVPVLWDSLVITQYTQPSYADSTKSIYNFFRSNRYLGICMSPADSARMLPWQKECMVDSVFTTQRTFRSYYEWDFRPCYYCKARGGAMTVSSWTKYPASGTRFILGYADDSLLCFAKAEQNYGTYPLTAKEIFSNVMLFRDGAHQLTLDSLFNPASDWRNFIINTVLTYVNTHQNIKGNCHNPAGIPAMLNETFELTPEGLYLYPEGFEENGNKLILLVPWKDLDAYLRNDLRSRLPVPKK